MSSTLIIGGYSRVGLRGPIVAGSYGFSPTNPAMGHPPTAVTDRGFTHHACTELPIRTFIDVRNPTPTFYTIDVRNHTIDVRNHTPSMQGATHPRFTLRTQTLSSWKQRRRSRRQSGAPERSEDGLRPSNPNRKRCANCLLSQSVPLHYRLVPALRETGRPRVGSRRTSCPSHNVR